MLPGLDRFLWISEIWRAARIRWVLRPVRQDSQPHLQRARWQPRRPRAPLRPQGKQERTRGLIARLLHARQRSFRRTRGRCRIVRAVWQGGHPCAPHEAAGPADERLCSLAKACSFAGEERFFASERMRFARSAPALPKRAATDSAMKNGPADGRVAVFAARTTHFESGQRLSETRKRHARTHLLFSTTKPRVYESARCDCSVAAVPKPRANGVSESKRSGHRSS